MYRRMLVPLDGSALAEVVLPYARVLAGRFNLDVALIYVADKKESKSFLLPQAYVDRTADTIRRDIAKNQKKKSGVPRESQGIKVSGEVMVGYPAEEILRYTDTNDIDLILMATHGRSGISRWVMGSVADRVLRSSRIPVLLVRAGIPQDIANNEWPDTMLVPLDSSGLAELVLPHVVALAKQPNAKTVKITLLMACEPLSIPAFAPPEFLANWGDMAAKQMAKSRNSAKKYLTRIEKQLNSTGLTVSSEVLEGQAAEEIVNYAAKNGSSLIVMATHGRSGLSRWAYGSVAEKVLLAASSPILLVRPASTGDPLPR
jgi:nucleotide-binding universal stress UspA family protein